jgi:hypothetical protein
MIIIRRNTSLKEQGCLRHDDRYSQAPPSGWLHSRSHMSTLGPSTSCNRANSSGVFFFFFFSFFRYWTEPPWRYITKRAKNALTLFPFTIGIRAAKKVHISKMAVSIGEVVQAATPGTLQIGSRFSSAARASHVSVQVTKTSFLLRSQR